MKGFILGFITCVIMQIIEIISVEPMKKKWRRQCNFNCENCRVWDCDKHLCDEQKRKEHKKG